MPQHPEYPNIPLKPMLCEHDLDQTYDLIMILELGGWRFGGYTDYAQYKNSRFFNYLLMFWEEGILIDYFTCDGAPFADQLSYILYQFYRPFGGTSHSDYRNYSTIQIPELYTTLHSIVDWENWIAVEVQLPAWDGSDGTDGKGTICYYLDESIAASYFDRLRYPSYCLNKKVIHYQLKSEPQTIRIPFDDYTFPVIGTFVCGGAMADEVEASIPSIWLYSNFPSLLEWLDARINFHWDDRELIIGGANWTFHYSTGGVSKQEWTYEYTYVPRPAWFEFTWLITANNNFGQLVEREDIIPHDFLYGTNGGGTIDLVYWDPHKLTNRLKFSRDDARVEEYIIHRYDTTRMWSGIIFTPPVVTTEYGLSEDHGSIRWDIYSETLQAAQAQYGGTWSNSSVSGDLSQLWSGFLRMTTYIGIEWYEAVQDFPLFAFGSCTTDESWYKDSYNRWVRSTTDVKYVIYQYTIGTGQFTEIGSDIATYTVNNENPSPTPVFLDNTYSGTMTLVPPSTILSNLDPSWDYGYTFEQYIQNQDLTIMVDSQRIKEIHAALQADKFAWMPNTTDTLRNANLGYYIERIARVLGISVKPDGSLRTIRPKKFIKAGEVIPAGWYGGCFGSNTGGSLQGQLGGTPEEERDGIVYEIKSNLYDPENGTIEAGGYALCENWIQYLDAMADDLDKALGWQELGAVALPSADGSRQVVYEGLITTLVEALFNTSALSMNTTQTQATSLATHQMVRELLRGLGLPLKEKIMPVDVGDADSDGYIAYPGYDTNSPTLSTLLFAILQNQGLALGSQVKVPDPVATTPQQ